MERITQRLDTGEAYFEGHNGKASSDIKGRIFGEAADKLADIEDIIEEGNICDFLEICFPSAKAQQNYINLYAPGEKTQQNYKSESPHCKHMFEEMEICVNRDCPYCADYCPVTEFPETCKFSEFKKQKKDKND